MEEQNNPDELRNTLEIIPSRKLVMGVCSAFGNYLNISPVVIRFFVLFAFIFIGQPVVLIYAAFGILLPINDLITNIEDDFSNKFTINLFCIGLLILIILIQFNQITFNEILEFVSLKIDSFTLLVFSIALIISGFHKEVINMNGSNFKQLRKSDKKIFLGVCGGLAEYLNINSNLMRILWVVFGLSSLGIAILIYLILGLIIPKKSSSLDHAE